MHSQTKPAVLSVGRLYCDLIFTELPRLPTLGTEVFTDGFGTHAGGGAFITAAHLSDMGHPSSLAAMLPSAPFGDLMRADLDGSGVDLSLSATLAEHEGPQITVAMANGGDRAFLTRRAGPAFPKIAAEDVAGRGFKHLHVGELASLVAHPQIIDLARSAGMSISVDCGWDDALEIAALRPLVGAVDVFLPNEAEQAALRQMGLVEAFAPITVVKQGHKGAMVISERETLEAPCTAVDVVDTTGAGDAFNAGFLSHWLMGAGLRECLDAGNMRGALTVQTRGGFSGITGDVQTGRFAAK